MILPKDIDRVGFNLGREDAFTLKASFGEGLLQAFPYSADAGEQVYESDIAHVRGIGLFLGEHGRKCTKKGGR